MIHERPGVWSAFGAQGTTELTDRRLAAVIAPADAAEGVQLVHSAAEAVSLYGGNALLTRMLKLCLANCGDPVYAVAVDEDTKNAYETALTALFAAAKPGVLIVGSAREDVQLLLRETAEANECLGVAGMKGASADALAARAKALCCARIVLTGPDVLAQDEAVADGFCAAAAVGGAIASLSTPVVPLHDVALFGLQSLSALYTEDELDKLLQAGVTPVQLSGGRMCALRILTTRAAAEGPEGESFRSLNATLVTDELLRTESGAGRRLVLRGRGMDALLEDCEFDAQTGTGITPAALATRVLQPVGLSAWSDAQSATGTLKTALGSTGSSIVQDYCASAGLLPPRMLADGRVCLTATRRSGGTALQGGTVRERSVQALAGIGVLHAAGTTYENPAGGRETRWRSALGWPAAAEFARSMRDRDAVRLTLPGTHALEPGTTAEVGGRTLTLTDCALRGSAAGITTELALAAL